MQIDIDRFEIAIWVEDNQGQLSIQLVFINI